MRPDEIERLLGGYATGTLTVQEREALFRAALDDQKLFNALAGEHAFKELLDDPRARAELLRALGERKPGLIEWICGWAGRPVAWAAAGGLAAAVLAGFLVIRIWQPMLEPEPVMIAKQEIPAPQAESTAPALRDIAPKIAPKNEPLAAPEPKEPSPRQLAEFRSAERPHPATEREVPPPPAPAAFAKPEAGAAQLKKKSAPAEQLAASRAELDVALVALPPAVRYHLQRLTPDGSYTDADASEVFAAGDSVRLVVGPSRAGFLRVTLEKSTEAQVPILAQQVVPGVTYPTSVVRLEPPAGDVTFRLTLTPQAPAAGFAVRAARSDLGEAKVADERKEASVEVTVKYR